MSATFLKILELVAKRQAIISRHGYKKLFKDGILFRDLTAGIAKGEPIEDYPDYAKGPCVLVLQHDRNGQPVHALWGIAKGQESPAVLVTAYRPDPARWSSDFRRRRK